MKMEGDSMKGSKKTTWILKQKSYVLAASLMVAAICGMTGIYFSEQNTLSEKQKNVVENTQMVENGDQQDETKDLLVESGNQESETENLLADNGSFTDERFLKEENEALEESKTVQKVISPENTDFLDDPETISTSSETVETEQAEKEVSNVAVTETKEEVETSVQEVSSPQAQQELHFEAGTEMGWPLQGKVLMNYQMDQTVYFATLDQYKYNPAMIIQGKVNDKVLSVADGKVTDITSHVETGCTVTVDLGDGYQAVYGQLKEVPVETGAYIHSGDIVGYVSEPTKYYSLEGPNLYFQMLKDGESVDPMEYLQ